MLDICKRHPDTLHRPCAISKTFSDLWTSHSSSSVPRPPPYEHRKGVSLHAFSGHQSATPVQKGTGRAHSDFLFDHHRVAHTGSLLITTSHYLIAVVKKAVSGSFTFVASIIAGGLIRISRVYFQRLGARLNLHRVSKTKVVFDASDGCR